VADRKHISKEKESLAFAFRVMSFSTQIIFFLIRADMLHFQYYIYVIFVVFGHNYP